MELNLEDLIPGSRWIQTDSNIVSEIVQGPYCSIQYDYSEEGSRYSRTFSIYKNEKPRRATAYGRSPKVTRKYLSGVSTKYLNKCSQVNAYSFLYHSQPLTHNHVQQPTDQASLQVQAYC
jgi:hypothetical protein